MRFSFTVIKKNQILAGAVTLMLVTAGYLNYKYDPTKAYDVEVTGIIEENLGDAVLVDSNGVIQDLNKDLVNSSDFEITNDGTTPVFQNTTDLNLSKHSGESNNSTALIDNSGGNKDEKVFKEIEDYFISTRIDRTNNYAEQIETYENIIEANNVTEEQKNKAHEEIVKINKIRNSIMIAENLIKLKGFDEAVILASDNLTSVEIAQLQSIIVNEFVVDISDIQIINYE